MNDPAVTRAMVKKLDAEARAYSAEARYHNLQSDRLKRARENEDAELESQRVLDFTDTVNARSVQGAINKLSEFRAQSSDPITVRIFTPGGDPIAGFALYDYIRLLVAEGIEVTTVGLWAASFGAVLLQAGSKRVVTPSAWLMVHEISVDDFGGTASQLSDEAKLIRRMQDHIAEALAERSTLTKTKIKRRWARKDWWLNAEEAVKYGFADEVAVSP